MNRRSGHILVSLVCAWICLCGAAGRINLRRTGPAEKATYTAKRATVGGGPYVLVATGLGNTTYGDTGLADDTPYYYVVSALGRGGEGTDSAEVAATTADLHAQLTFDESNATTAADSTGDGWNGTLVNGPARVPGRINNAVSLTGGSHVTLPGSVVNTLHDFTISAWVKLNGISAWSRVFDFGSGTGKYLFLTPLNEVNNRVRYAITTSGNGGEQVIGGQAALPAGAWTHVAVTLSGSTGTLYVDGVAVGSNPAMTITPSDLGNTTQNYLGKSQWPDPALDAPVDEFAIRNRALSAAEITALAVAPPAAPAGLVAAGGTAEVTLSWNASPGATAYAVLRSTTGGGPYAPLAGGATTATTHADTGLPDGDGWTNAREFVAGTDPNDRSSLLKINTLQVNGADMIVGFPTVSGKSCRLERSLNLQSGSWVTVADNIAGTGGEVSTTDANTVGQPRLFYRLVTQ